ncbi:MAG: hypothetical protein H0X62_09050 [Bacteroidetes bacterium]|nr:hypothetical protein [Bacteroidota bacterium]
MIVYKFRVTFEDPEDVSRDIEIKPGHTFEAFHKAIQESINFDSSGEANFYVSDLYWRKGEKIPFESLGNKKLVQYLEDPRQKFIYEYESKSKKWPFNIELVKIIDGEEGNTYPQCVKSSGIAPVQFSLINPVLTDEEISNEAGMSEEIDDAIFYRDAEDMEGFTETEDPELKSAGFVGDNDDESEESEFDGEEEAGSFEEEDY